MDVEHALPGVAPGVEDQAVRPVEGVVGERLGDLDHMRELRGIGAGQLGDVRVMVLVQNRQSGSLIMILLVELLPHPMLLRRTDIPR